MEAIALLTRDAGKLMAKEPIPDGCAECDSPELCGAVVCPHDPGFGDPAAFDDSRAWPEPKS